MTIDWNGELEAYHVDGRVVAVVLAGGISQPTRAGLYSLTQRCGEKIDNHWYFDVDGNSNDGWRIRNRATQPTPEQEAVTLVRRAVAHGYTPDWLSEARRIVARMEPEIDPIIVQARKIALNHSLPALTDCMTSWKVNQGEADDKPYMKAIVEALRARNEGDVK